MQLDNKDQRHIEVFATRMRCRLLTFRDHRTGSRCNNETQQAICFNFRERVPFFCAAGAGSLQKVSSNDRPVFTAGRSGAICCCNSTITASSGDDPSEPYSRRRSVTERDNSRVDSFGRGCRNIGNQSNADPHSATVGPAPEGTQLSVGASSRQARNGEETSGERPRNLTECHLGERLDRPNDPSTTAYSRRRISFMHPPRSS